MSSTRVWINKLPNKHLLHEFVTYGFFPPLLAQILINKGFTDINSAYSFLYPKITDFSDPFLIPEMDLAVKKIHKALKNNERILIYGDSDADGIIGTFVLYHFLKQLTPLVSWFIPDKNQEGYGFHSKFLPEIKAKGFKLLITVDVGISAWETVNSAKALGIDVIVTDHHEIKQKPDTITITGKLTPEDSPFYHLCGAGVVFALIRALRSYLYHQGFFKDISPPNLRKYLELVCIATLADMVPLLGENRTITYIGFRDLLSPSFAATKVLLKDLFYGISEEEINYKVIPKINACGRLGVPELAFKLLDAQDEETAQKYLQKIETLNTKRQEIEIETINEFLTEIQKISEKPENLVFFVKQNIPKGLTGLIANRLKNMYNLPAIVISLEDGTGFGSGRSPDGLNLLKVISECKDILVQYGGHKHAFGFQIKKELIPELKKRLETHLLSIPFKDPKKEYLYIDAETTLTELGNREILYALSQFHPYGEGHHSPKLLIKNFEVKNIKILKEKHSKLFLKQGLNEICAIYFNKILDKENIRLIVGCPYINSFNNSLELKVEDVK